MLDELLADCDRPAEIIGQNGERKQPSQRSFKERSSLCLCPNTNSSWRDSTIGFLSLDQPLAVISQRCDRPGDRQWLRPARDGQAQLALVGRDGEHTAEVAVRAGKF